MEQELFWQQKRHIIASQKKSHEMRNGLLSLLVKNTGNHNLKTEDVRPRRRAELHLGMNVVQRKGV